MLLQTKLISPRLVDTVVVRERLVKKLERGIKQKLSLITAPAGFGKTTLISCWLQEKDHDYAWLTLDQNDNDNKRFWAYVVAAFQSVVTDLDVSPIENKAGIVALINSLSMLDRTVVLILDDFHLIDSIDVQDNLNFLIENAPPDLHLVILTRSEPSLALAKLRIRGQLNELTVDDLRFSANEAARFLTEVMQLDVTEEIVARLDEKVEGWIAGLQILALSMRDNPQSSEVLSQFEGGLQYLFSFLAEEIMAHLPPDTHQFLLMTSILDTMTPELCDSVAQFKNSGELLDQLVRDNLFVTQMRGNVYRYHPLFREFLLTRLELVSPAIIPELHRRAGAWCAENNALDMAIEHYLEAEVFEKASELIEAYVTIFVWQPTEALRIQRWLDRIPRSLFEENPPLALIYAWVLVSSFNVKDVETYLKIADRRGANAGEIAAIRCELAIMTNRIQDALSYGEQALSMVEDDNLVRGTVMQMMGYAHRLLGNVGQASVILEESYHLCRAAGIQLTAMFALSDLAEVKIQQGKLQDAHQILSRILSDNDAQIAHAGAYTTLSKIFFEWGEVQEALASINKSIEIASLASFEGVLRVARLTKSRYLRALGDLDKAAAVLRSATQSAYDVGLSRQIAYATDHQILLAIDKGDLATVDAWWRERGLGIDDEFDYRNEFDYVTLARALMALENYEHAITLLKRLVERSRDAGRIGNLIEDQVLLASAYHAIGNTTAAHKVVQAAHHLGDEQGYRHIFTMLPFNLDPQSILIEPLTERELDVLGFMAGGMTNKEIAEELIIGASTVKTHTLNIYRKLDVRNRTEAVQKAAELGLI